MFYYAINPNDKKIELILFNNQTRPFQLDS